MSLNRRRFLRDVALCGSSALGLGAAQDVRPTGAVTVRVVDEKSGRPLAARVRLIDSQGEVVPLGHPSRLAEGAEEGDVRFQSRRYCYVDGEFAVDRAQLPLRYQLLKGHQYRMAEGKKIGDRLLFHQFVNLPKFSEQSGNITD